MIVSVNPFKVIPSLGEHLIPDYQMKDVEKLPPHLYAIAQRAYSQVNFL
jgi:myosin heavy subunit